MKDPTETTRTWLCGDCDDERWHSYPGRYGMPYCETCDSDRIRAMTYAEAQELGLKPWGDHFRSIWRARRPVDPLTTIRFARNDRAHPLGGVFHYRDVRRCAYAPVADKLRRLEVRL